MLNQMMKVILIMINLTYSSSFVKIIENFSVNIKQKLEDDTSISYYNSDITINYRLKKINKIIYKKKKKDSIRPYRFTYYI